MGAPETAGKTATSDLVPNVASDLSRIIKATHDYSKYTQSRFGVSGPQLRALWELRNAKGRTISELARGMHVHPSTASGVADRLGTKGLVRRFRDTNDHRVVHVQIADAGVSLLETSGPPVRHRLLRALESIPERHLRSLSRALSVLAEAMENEDREPEASRAGP